jgi:hypothetical protein
MARMDKEVTPRHLLGVGAAAGLGATVLLSLIARIPAIRTALARSPAPSTPEPPRDPYDRAQVRAWQERSWSPAARQPVRVDESDRGAGIGPATALRQPEAPGPEGLAEQFAYKVASGLFDRDIAASLTTYGRAVHAAYGTLWGVLYRLVMSGRAAPRPIPGALYGLAIYAIGPALLLPAMRIMAPPEQERPARTSLLIAAHLVYGLALSNALALIDSRQHGEIIRA